MSKTSVIEAAGLGKTYRDGTFRARDIQALKDVTFQVEPGEIFGLLGPNGAGKTTFIKILLGIIRKSEGDAKLMGRDAGERSGRAKVGYLPEHLSVPKHHTAATALEYYGQLSGMAMGEVKARRDDVLKLVGLADRAGDKVSKYSKGMLQRLGLGQTMMHNPELLILDEPTDGLDPVGRSQVRAVLARLRDEGKTIFLNSHLLQEVELICDRVAILDRGQLKRVGAVEEITADPSLPAADQETADPTAAAPKLAIELEMELITDEPTARTALGDRQIKSLESASRGRLKAVVVLEDQPAVDTCIDALRSAEISIVRLTPRRVSLEEVFLQTIGDPT